jgi:hypothetical protein
VLEIPLADGMANLQERIRLMAEAIVNETMVTQAETATAETATIAALS